MKFNLNIPVRGLTGAVLQRHQMAKEMEGDNGTLTIGFAVAHIMASAVEDIAVLDQAASQSEAAPYQGLPSDQLPAAAERARALRTAAKTEKLARGQLALRLAEADTAGEEVELSSEDLKRILDVCVPRMLPVILAQLHNVIN